MQQQCQAMPTMLDPCNNLCDNLCGTTHSSFRSHAYPVSPSTHASPTMRVRSPLCGSCLPCEQCDEPCKQRAIRGRCNPNTLAHNTTHTRQCPPAPPTITPCHHQCCCPATAHVKRKANGIVCWICLPGVGGSTRIEHPFISVERELLRARRKPELKLRVKRQAPQRYSGAVR
jgi:hypothetical protein